MSNRPKQLSDTPILGPLARAWAWEIGLPVKEMDVLHEKYRPKDWPDVIGQDKITAFLGKLETAGKLTGKALWLSGRSGNGKSSIARIIARKVSSEMYTAEFDAGELTPATLRNIEEELHYAPMGARARCFVVNEAHGLRKDSARILLRLLEYPFLSDSVVWIFTTTKAGQLEFEDSGIDANPLLSRCIHLTLAERGVGDAAAAFLQRVAQAEGLDGQPIGAYKKLFYDCGSNFRAALGQIESGAMKV